MAAGGGIVGSGTSPYQPSFTYTAQPDIAGTSGILSLSYSQRYASELQTHDVSSFRVVISQFPSDEVISSNVFNGNILNTITDTNGRKYAVADVSVEYIWIMTNNVKCETTFIDGSTAISTVKTILNGGIVSSGESELLHKSPTVLYTAYDISGLLQVQYKQEYSYLLNTHDISGFSIRLQKTSTYEGDPEADVSTYFNGSILSTYVDSDANNIATATVNVNYYHGVEYNVSVITTFSDGTTTVTPSQVKGNTYTGYKELVEANPPSIDISSASFGLDGSLTCHINYSIKLQHFIYPNIPDYNSISKVTYVIQTYIRNEDDTSDIPVLKTGNIALTFNQDPSGNYIGSASVDVSASLIPSAQIIPDRNFNHTVIVQTYYRDSSISITPTSTSFIFSTPTDYSNYNLALTLVDLSGSTNLVKKVKTIPTFNLRNTATTELHFVNPTSLYDISFGYNTMPVGCQLICDIVPYLTNARLRYTVPSGNFDGGTFIELMQRGAVIERVDASQPISILSIMDTVTNTQIRDYALTELYLSSSQSSSVEFGKTSLPVGCVVVTPVNFLTNAGWKITVPSGDLFSTYSGKFVDIISAFVNNSAPLSIAVDIGKLSPSSNCEFVLENNDVIDLTYAGGENGQIQVRANNPLRRTTLNEIYLSGDQYKTLSFLENSLPSGCIIKVENNDWVSNAYLSYRVPLTGTFAGGIFKWATDPRYSTYSWHPLTFQKKDNTQSFEVKSATAWPASLFRDASGFSGIYVPTAYSSVVNGNYTGISFGVNSLPPNCLIKLEGDDYIANAYSCVSTPTSADFSGGTIPAIFASGLTTVIDKIDNSLPFSLKYSQTNYQIPASRYRNVQGLTSLTITEDIYGKVTFGTNALPPGCTITAPVYLLNNAASLSYTTPAGVDLSAGYVHDFISTGHPIIITKVDSTLPYSYKSPHMPPTNSFLRYSNINEYVIESSIDSASITFGMNSLPSSCKIITADSHILKDCKITITLNASGVFAGGSIIDILSLASAVSVEKLNQQTSIILQSSLSNYAFDKSDLSGNITISSELSNTIQLGIDSIPVGCTLIADINDYLESTRISYTIPSGTGRLLNGSLYDAINTGTTIPLTETSGRSYFVLKNNNLPANCFLRNTTGLNTLSVPSSLINTAVFGNNSLPAGCIVLCDDTEYLENARISISIPSGIFIGDTLRNLLLGYTKTITRANSNQPIVLNSSITQLATNGYLRKSNLSELNISATNWATLFTLNPSSLPVNCQISVGSVSDTWHNPTKCWNNNGDPYSTFMTDMIYTASLSNQKIVRYDGIYYTNYDTVAQLLWIPTNIRQSASSPTSLTLAASLRSLPNWFRALDIDTWNLPSSSFSIGYFDQYVTSKDKDIALIYYGTTYTLKQGAIGVEYSTFPSSPSGTYAILGNSVSTYRLPIDTNNYKTYNNTTSTPTITNLIIPATTRTIPVIGWDNYFTFNRNEMPNNQIYTFCGIRWRNSRTPGGSRIVDMSSNPTVVTLMPNASDLYTAMFKDNTTIQRITFFNDSGRSSASIPAEFAQGCTALQSHDITIRDSVGSNAFSGCTSLQSVSISPSAPLTIGTSAYANCTGLTSIAITSTSDLTIGDSAFANCTGVTSITILCSGTLTIAANAFAGCTGVQNLAISGLRSSFSWTALSALKTVSLSFVSTDSTYTLSSFANATNLESFILSGGRVSLATNQFNGCGKLATLTVSSSIVGDIGITAFAGCTDLTSIVLPYASNAAATFAAPLTSLTSLQTVSLTGGVNVTPTNFCQGCSSLRNLTINGTLSGALHSSVLPIIWNVTLRATSPQTVPAYTYAGNTNLRTFDVSPLSSIGEGAFFGCTNLQSITLPEGLTSIGNYAFVNTGISGEVVIPSTTLALGDIYFAGCPNLRKLTYRCPVLMFKDPTQLGADMWEVLHTPTTTTFDISGVTVVTKGIDASLNITYTEPGASTTTLTEASLYSNLNLEKFDARITAFENVIQYFPPLYNIVSDPSNNLYDISNSLIVGEKIEKLRACASLCNETYGPISDIAAQVGFNQSTSSFSDIIDIATAAGKQADIAAAATAFAAVLAANTNMFSTPTDPLKILSVPIPTTLPTRITLPLSTTNISRVIGENSIDLCGGVLYMRYNIPNLVIGLDDMTLFDISGTVSLNIDTHMGSNIASVLKYLYTQRSTINNSNIVNFAFTGALTSINILDNKFGSTIDISSAAVTIADNAMDLFHSASVIIKADLLKIYNNAFNSWENTSLTITANDIFIGKDIFMSSKNITVSSNQPLINTPKIQMIDFGSTATVLDVSSIIWQHTGVPEAKIRDLNISTYIPKENPGYVRGYCLIKFQDVDTLKEHVLIAQPEDWFWCYRGTFSQPDFGGGPKDDKYNTIDTNFKYVDEATSGLTNSFAPDLFTYNGVKFTRKASTSKSTASNVLLRAVKSELQEAKNARARNLPLFLGALELLEVLSKALESAGMIAGFFPGIGTWIGLALSIFGIGLGLLQNYLENKRIVLSTAEIIMISLSVGIPGLGGVVKLARASSVFGKAILYSTSAVKSMTRAVANTVTSATKLAQKSASKFIRKISLRLEKPLKVETGTFINEATYAIQTSGAKVLKANYVAPPVIEGSYITVIPGRMKSIAMVKTLTPPQRNAAALITRVDKLRPLVQRSTTAFVAKSEQATAIRSARNKAIRIIDETGSNTRSGFTPMYVRKGPGSRVLQDSLIDIITEDALIQFATDTDSLVTHPNWPTFISNSLISISQFSDVDEIQNAVSYIYRLQTADFTSAFDAQVNTDIISTSSSASSVFSDTSSITLNQLATYNTIVSQPTVAVLEANQDNVIFDDDMETSRLTAAQVVVPPYIFPMTTAEADGPGDTQDKLYYYFRHGTKYSHGHVHRNSSGRACSVTTSANPLLLLSNYMWRDTYLGGATTPGNVERAYQGYLIDYNNTNVNASAPHVILSYNNDNELLYLGSRKVEYNISDYEAPNNVFCGVENLTIVVPEGVTDISSYAFCSTDGTDGGVPFNIKTVILPSTIERINSKAFYRAGVQTVVYPSSIKYIGRSVFENCGLVNAIAMYPDRDFASPQSVSITLHPTTEIAYAGTNMVLRGFDTATVITAAGATVQLQGIDSTGAVNTISINSSFATLLDASSVVITTPPNVIGLSPITLSPAPSEIRIPITTTRTYLQDISDALLKYNNQDDGMNFKISADWTASLPDFYAAPGVTWASVWNIKMNGGYYYKNYSITLKPTSSFIVNSPAQVIFGTGYAINRSLRGTRDISGAVIEPSAFYGNTTLEVVTFPDNVVSIGANAFDGCTSLRTVDIPTTVTTIDDGAFANSGLTSIVIPSSVTTVGSNLFEGISQELAVVFTSDTVPTAVQTILTQLPSSSTLFVPPTAVSSFTALVADLSSGITVQADTPAGPPTNVAITAANQQITVNWSAPTSTGGSPITSYTLYYTPAGGAEVTVQNASSPATITGLTNRTSYTARVVAVKAVGAGTPSATVSATPLPDGPTVFTNILSDAYATPTTGTRYFMHYFDLSAGTTAVNLWAKTGAQSATLESIVRLYSATSTANLLNASHATIITDASLAAGTITFNNSITNTSRTQNISLTGLQAGTRHYIVSKTTNDVSGQELGIALQTLAGINIPINFVKTATAVNATTQLVSSTDVTLNQFIIDGISVSNGSILTLRNKESVSVVASPTDPDAIVAINGATGLTDGSNNLVVTVTAADGTTTGVSTVVLAVSLHTISSNSQTAITNLTTGTSNVIQTVASSIINDISSNSSNKGAVVTKFIENLKITSDIDATTRVAAALAVAMKLPHTNNSLKQTFNSSLVDLGLAANIAYDLPATEASATVAAVETQFKNSSYNPSSLAIVIPDMSTNSMTIDLNKSDLVLNFVPGVSYTVNALYGNTTSTNSYTVAYTRTAIQRYLTVDGSQKGLNDTFTFSFTNASDRFIKIEATGSIIISNNEGTNNPVCFLGSAPVLTPSGYRRIDKLQVGDLVMTADGRTVAVQKIKTQVAVPGPMSNPFIIPAGQYGAIAPLAISPRHRVMVPGRGLLEAQTLGLKQMPMRAHWTYYNLGLPCWQTDNLVVGGVAVESLAPVERVRMPLSSLRTLLLKKYGAKANSEMVIRQVLATCRMGSDGLIEAPVIRRNY